MMYELPEYNYLFSLCDKVTELLDNEVTDYRPLSDNKNPGSLLELNPDLPAVIVPDIHARPDFVKNILKYKLKKNFCGLVNQTVKSALEKGIINVICVGDAVHTETNAERWQLINEEFSHKLYTGNFMKEEMAETLTTLCSIMELKLKYPVHFHFLKGNHENIMNATENGDFAFKKFAQEGAMVKRFVQDYYGDDILYLISCYEKLLPLIAYGKNFVVSHAEPACAFTKKQLINARKNGETVQALIWTGNDVVKENTAEKIIEELLQPEDAQNALYFAGHRPVKTEYALRQDGKFVQIHNPHRQNICLVSNKRPFDLDKDIVSVCKKKVAGGEHNE